MEKHSTLTVGVDIGDRFSQICVIDEIDGELMVVEEARIATTQNGVTRYFGSRSGEMLVALEVGTHSPWMSAMIESLGHEVVVANSRKIKFIYESDDKTDSNDAEKLARVARMDRSLLHPIIHRDARILDDRVMLRSRDAVVRCRKNLINHIRGVMKSAGERLPSCSAESFHKHYEKIPSELKPALAPVLDIIEQMTTQIRELEIALIELGKQKYPVTQALQQISGIGPITSLAFVLTLEDPHKFKNTRAVGKYLGLTPKLDQSGDSDKQLKITRSGDKYTRSLLVNCAHRIMGQWGTDCDLRSYGMRIAERGGKNAKKRAVVAVARKLAVLMLALWKSGDDYAPFRNSKVQKSAA